MYHTRILHLIAVREFKEVLRDVEERVSELTHGIHQLEHCTVDTISLEELLGHCHEVYQSNRQGITALERHLQQYGYSADPAPEVEPTDPFMSASAISGTYESLVTCHTRLASHNMCDMPRC